MKLVQWQFMGGMLHLVQRGGDCTKCNSSPINASTPITVLLYSCPLLCRFNVPIKELNFKANASSKLSKLLLSKHVHIVKLLWSIYKHVRVIKL